MTAKEKYLKQREEIRRQKEEAKKRAIEEALQLEEFELSSNEPEKEAFNPTFENFLKNECYILINEDKENYYLFDRLLNIEIVESKKKLKKRFEWWKNCKDWQIDFEV